jgi:alkylation response protein AidB-like acyl-CoA dehydrogenase
MNALTLAARRVQGGVSGNWRAAVCGDAGADAVMDLTFSSEYQAFRAEVRAFLAEHWDATRSRDEDFVDRFRCEATARGYLYRAIPKRYGGSEQPADVLKAQIIAEEFMAARAPQEVTGQGTMMLVPVLLEVGEEWQREKFIEPTIRGKIKWAQGYSEPGAGSDLASLRTRAELMGDEWVINGQKIWTTRANESDYMFILCRTEPDAPKHQGISYLLIDFKQPGITIRPIKQISGEQEFYETFLDDARTPKDWIVGERGKGWEISKVNLKHERNGVGSAARAQALLRSIVKLAKEAQIDGKPAIEHPRIRDRLAAIDAYVMTQTVSGYYQTTLGSRGESPGVLGLAAKLNNTEIGKMISELAMDIAGEAMLTMPPEKGPAGLERWFKQVMGSLGMSIAGGASNIQRNIIAERGLDLPREALA